MIVCLCDAQCRSFLLSCSVFMTRHVLDISFVICCLCAALLGGLRFGFQFAARIFPTWKVQSIYVSEFIENFKFHD